MMFADGLFIDGFAGGGGASTGIAQAIGHDPDITINQSPTAIAIHKANHPDADNHWTYPHAVPAPPSDEGPQGCGLMVLSGLQGIQQGQGRPGQGSVDPRAVLGGDVRNLCPIKGRTAHAKPNQPMR